jgi:hypothetical protein
MASQGSRERILIWGKTYPELSSKYLETVCTAGVTESGRPVRLYPIPYRYLTEQFSKYQWITASISKNQGDARPESYKIDWDSIECGEEIPTTTDEWGKRAQMLFGNDSWQFETMEKLQDAQKADGKSIGVVVPRQIRKVDIVGRDEAEIKSFDEKVRVLKLRLYAQRAQLTLFEQAVPPEMKNLEFLKARIHIHWLCNSPECKGHKMQVLDWEVCELQRRLGDDAALKKVREITDLSRFALRFFLGNLFLHPHNFMIVGLWYPKRANLLFH